MDSISPVVKVKSFFCCLSSFLFFVASLMVIPRKSFFNRGFPGHPRFRGPFDQDVLEPLKVAPKVPNLSSRTSASRNMAAVKTLPLVNRKLGGTWVFRPKMEA